MLNNFLNQNKFADILKQYQYKINPGEIVAGTIIYQEYKGFLVEIGHSICGYLPDEEIKINSSDYKKKSYLLILQEIFS